MIHRTVRAGEQGSGQLSYSHFDPGVWQGCALRSLGSGWQNSAVGPSQGWGELLLSGLRVFICKMRRCRSAMACVFPTFERLRPLISPLLVQGTCLRGLSTTIPPGTFTPDSSFPELPLPLFA